MPGYSKRLALLAAGIIFVSIFSFVQPAVGFSAESQRLLDLMNSARQRAGLPALQSDATLNAIAENHAARMAAAGRVFHNGSYPSGAGSWESWGENVGTGPTVDDVHKAFMASAVHKANILSRSFNLVGVGVARWGQGIMVVEDFIGRAGAAPPAPVRRVATRSAVKQTPKPVVEAPPAPPPEPAATQQEVDHYLHMARWEQLAVSSFDPPAPIERK